MTWNREHSLRTCAYLMIGSGNRWGSFDPEKIIETYMGPNSGFTVKRFEKLWNDQLSRFEREQLTKCVNSISDGGDGK